MRSLDGVSFVLNAHQATLSAWTDGISHHAAFYDRSIFQRGDREAFGDPAFDQEFTVAGEYAVLCAWLPAAMRGALLASATWSAGVSVESGVVRLRFGLSTHEHLEHAMQFLSSLAKWFSCDSDDIAARLMEMSFHEPARDVRFRAISELSLRFPATEAARSACIRLQDDEDEGVSCVAAMEVGYVKALDRALCSKDPELVQHAARFVDTRMVAPRARSLRAALEPLPRPDIAELLVRALETSADPAKEAVLCELLDLDEKVVRVWAAQALGRVGTPASVSRLAKASRLFSFAANAELRAAISAITERHLSASTGDLSLIREGGELSTAGEDGALSLER